jgi:hypothetical protein
VKHEIHVERGLEFDAECYVFCICDLRPETTTIANQFKISPLDKSVFRGKGIGELAAFLRKHASPPPANGHKQTGPVEAF